MIPPTYYASSSIEQVRRARSDTVQAVPDREDMSVQQHDENSLFSDCVLDLSKYLTSSDMSTSPQAYFNEIFDAEKNRTIQSANLVKVKEEPLDESQPTSRCSTPESMLPENDFEKNEFSSPMLQPLGGLTGPYQQQQRPAAMPSTFHPAVNVNGMHTPAIHAALQGSVQNGMGGLKLPLFSQLQTIHRYNNNNAVSAIPLTSTASSIASSIQSSANTSDTDGSDEELSPDQLSINAKRLQHALAKLENQPDQMEQYDLDPKPEPMDMEGYYPNYNHANKYKSQQQRNSKSRKYIEKGTEEYVLKRERNNVAVRKSRTKAKLKHIETQMRVGELSEENSSLRNRITSLQKEVNALKSYISYNIPKSGSSSATSSPIKSQPSQSQTPAPPVSPVYSSSYRGSSPSAFSTLSSNSSNMLWDWNPFLPTVSSVKPIRFHQQILAASATEKRQF